MLTWVRALLIAAIGGHWLLQTFGDRLANFWIGVALHGVATVAYIVLCRAVIRESYKPGLREAFALAVLLRLLVLPLEPALSDDVYRYMHEGNLVLQGHNPYLTAPADVAPELRHPEYWQLINHKEIAAAYPPGVQYALAAGYALHPTPLGMKLVFGLCDLLVFVVLWFWLPKIGLPACRAVIHGLCPLMVLEFAGEGHSDSLAVLFLMLCLWAYSGGHRYLSSSFLSIATAGKLLPLAALPFLARGSWFAVVPFAAVMLALYAPFVLDADVLSGEYTFLEVLHRVPDLFSGTLTYLDKWRHNDSIYHLLHAASETGLQWLDDSLGGTLEMKHYPHRVAQVPVYALGLTVLSLAWLRRWPLHKVMAAFFMFFVSCTSTLHPWYLAFLVPFLCIYPTFGWLLFTGTVYVAHWIPNWEIGKWGKFAEYLPFYLGFLSILTDTRTRRGKGEREQLAAER